MSEIMRALGSFNIDGNEDHISEIHLYSSEALGLGLNMIATNDKFTIDIKQSYSTSRYAEALVEELKSLSLDVTLRGPIYFETPKDRIVDHGEERKGIFSLLSL